MKKIAFLVILLVILIGILAPHIAPYDPEDFSYEGLLQPSNTHFLGTNSIGQDLFSNLLMGFRTSVSIGLMSALISTLIGTTIAVFAAYYGGIIDRFLIKMTDFFMIIPEIIVIMFFGVFAGQGIWNIIFAISFFSWSKVAKIVRSKAVHAINKESVQYTLMMKGTPIHVLRKLWPALFPSIVTLFVLQCSKAILYEANLAFLGIGDPTLKSWGMLIKQAMAYEGLFIDQSYMWWLIPPIICIMVFVSALSILCFDLKNERA